MNVWQLFYEDGIYFLYEQFVQLNLNKIFLCYWHWSSLTLISPMFSSMWQCFLLYQVQCHTLVNTIFYSVLCWFSLHSLYHVATVELWRLESFWEINMDQTVEINKNNLDYKGLIKICRYLHWQGKISTLLNRTLYKFFGFASSIIVTSFFCRVNIFLI
jgi:hypothetical protein